MYDKYKNISVSVRGIVPIVVATALVTFIISATVFITWDYINPPYKIEFEPEEVNVDSIKKFDRVRNILKNDFYEQVDENVLLEGAVSGMARSLSDAYTVYYTKEQMDMIMEISSKSYENYVGIGTSVIMDDNGLLTVVEPYEGSPAAEAGMMQGDKIIEVNGEDVTGIKEDSVIVDMIKGPENTHVKVTVYRPSEIRNIEFDLVRKKLKVALNIRSDIMEGDIGYIRLYSFNDKSIYNLFQEHLNTLLGQGIKGLIIDVRDNLGGYYDQVTYITDRIIPEGIIVYTEDREKKQMVEKSDETELEVPLVVLINGNSASASEVLAGAVKDHGKGVLIGTRTFGKGVVQELKFLGDGSGLKLTTSRYFTPSGICIHGVGIDPDIEVLLEEKYSNLAISQVPKQDDRQLQKAVDVLRTKTK